MLASAKSMTWKDLHPVVELSHTVYGKGISLSKQAMQAVESRLGRNPLLPKRDILTRPVARLECSLRSPEVFSERNRNAKQKAVHKYSIS